MVGNCGFICLGLLLALSTPYIIDAFFVPALRLITASYAHEWHHTKHYTSERLLKLSQQDDFELAHTDFHASASLSSWGSESYYLHIKRELFGLVSCRRTSATDGVLSSDFTPDYFFYLLLSLLHHYWSWQNKHLAYL